MLDAWERDSDDDESDDGFVVDAAPPPAPAAAAVPPEDGFVIDTAPPASLPWSSKRKGAGSCTCEERHEKWSAVSAAPILTGNESTVHTRAVLTCKLREATTSFGPAQSFAGSCSIGAVDGTTTN